MSPTGGENMEARGRAWVVAAVLGTASAAQASDLRCTKLVNGERSIVVDDYPATLQYDLAVRNTHPTLPSTALVVADALLASQGFTFTPTTPFTLPVAGAISSGFTIHLQNEGECRRLAALDGVEDLLIDNTFYVGWASGASYCSARVECRPQTNCPPDLPVDDHNPCTADSCDPSTGVIHTPTAAGTACSDGDACNGSERCDGYGHCAPGMPPVIDDDNPCTADLCDLETGLTHTLVQAGTSCSDGDVCNGSELCDATGLCAAGTSPLLEDDNPCTADSCDPRYGVEHAEVATGTACSDGNACNGDETCDSFGRCKAEFAPELDDRNPCTADACDPITGVTHTAVAAGTACGDNNVCNGNETCDASARCRPGPAPNLDDANPCTADSCDLLSGIKHTQVTTGTSCPDANACNGAERCDAAGRCQPGSPPELDDRNDCTIDSCDPILGVKHTKIVSGQCGDDDACDDDDDDSSPHDGSCQVPGATRTMGFFKTHLDDLNRCLAQDVDLGFLVLSASNRTRAVDQSLGLLWGSPNRFAKGTKRNALDKARFLLGRQTLVGICNVRLFAADDALVRRAVSALSGRSCQAQSDLANQVDRFNNSGDQNPLPNGYQAGPTMSQQARSRAADPTVPSGLTCTN